MYFDLPFSFFPIALLVLLAAGALIWSVFRLQAWIPTRYRITLGLLRGVALLALFLALTNPYFVREDPDPDAFELVLLADSSGSMETPDTQRINNRAEAVRSMINFEESSNTGMWLKMHVCAICDQIVEEREIALTRKVGKPPRHIHKDEKTPDPPQLQQDSLFEEKGD